VIFHLLSSNEVRDCDRCLNLGARGYYGSSEFGRQAIGFWIYPPILFSVCVPLLTLPRTFLFLLSRVTLDTNNMIMYLNYVLLYYKSH
jgi:hypothetical protein